MGETNDRMPQPPAAAPEGFVPPAPSPNPNPSPNPSPNSDFAPVPMPAAAPGSVSQASAQAFMQAPVPAPFYGDPHDAVPETLRPGRHHVHHTYIWLGGIRASLSVIVALAVVAFGNIVSIMADSEASDAANAAALGLIIPFVIGGVVLVVALLALVVFLVQWLSWKNLTYELGPDEFSLYSGIINKKRMHVPYQRVQAVNQQAGLFQRLVGVCNVKIDTAGGAANDGVNLQYLRTSDAEALRSELFRRKKALMAGGTIAPDGTAMVGGVPYLSAWAVADAGMYPQGVPRASFGYVMHAAAVSDASDGAACGVGAPGSPLVAPSVGSTASETNVLDVADEVLQDVRGVFGGSEVDTGRVRYETGLSNKELLLAGASGAGEGLGLLAVGIIAAVGSVAQIFDGVIGKIAEDWFDSTVGTNGLTLIVNGGAGSFIGAAAFQMILWALLAAAALWALSALGTVVRYGGFRLRRREDRVEVESGLLSRSFHGVDVDRIQSVVVKQSFIRRLMGYCELSVLKIDSAAESDASGSGAQQQLSKGVVVHPFVKMSRVHEIIRGVLPEFADMPDEAFRPAPVARRRAVVRKAVIRSAAFWLAVFVALCQIAMEAAIAFVPMDAESAVLISIFRQLMFAYYVVFALAFVVNVADALLWHRRSGLGYDRGFMSMTNGGLSTTVTYTPRKKIQFAYLRTNPFQRMARVASVNVRTAAGIGGTTETLWDLPEDDAAAWLEWVRPRGRRAQ